MKQLTVNECMSKQFVKVLDKDHPAPSLIETVFAVYATSTETGPFLGLATSHDVALHTDWIFADFVQHRKQFSIKKNSTVRQALAVMKKANVSILPVFNAANQLVGVATELHLLQALYQREHFLLREIRQQQDALSHDNSEKTALILQIEEQIRQMRISDSLTGLPNLAQVRLKIQHLLASAKSKENQGAILLIGLDNFRDINGIIGSHFGDRILQQVAERLLSMLPDSSILARKGGDEFIITLVGDKYIDSAALYAKSVLNALTQPFMLDGQNILITASIGICFYPLGVQNVEVLLANADIALKRAKDKGKNTYQIFLQEMGDRVKELKLKETHLRKALQQNELFICYQPQVNTVDNQIIGLEALIRWQNPELGLVLPNDFIPMAEKTGLILPIGEWVLHTACKQAMCWQQNGKALRISINLSACQFHGTRKQGVYQLVKHIEAVLAESRLPPELLEIEITESVILRNHAVVLATLKQLKNLGVRISCDDFGTGYSSLNYLKQLPFDTIKIDKSFIDDIGSDLACTAIVRSIILLAQELRIEVIAEGVETKKQLIIMSELGCSIVQGFYFSKPLSLDDATLMLQKGVTLSS